MEVNSLRSWKLKGKLKRTIPLCTWHPKLSSSAKRLTSSQQRWRNSHFNSLI